MLLSPTNRSRLKIARAHAFERIGSERYSYPGLHDLDRLVQPYLTAFQRGTFLEIGAYDGYSKSNTYQLERAQGWRGILIEPLPSVFRICQKHRTGSACYNVACVSAGGPAEIELVDRGLMTVAPDLVPEVERQKRIGPAIESIIAPTMTLSSIIDDSEFETINLMSIDVEGAELEVLGGLDIDRHRPDVLLVETDRPEDIEKAFGGSMKLDAQLSFHDYVLVAT